MTITAYTGLPGSGKSYEVANGPIQTALEKGRPVWTNVPVTDPRATVVTNVTEHWYLDAPPGALICIDECWRYWPAGMKADSIPENIKEFFAMHRHRTADGAETEIVLVTQDLSQIASFVRQLVDKTYRMRKLNNIGFSSKYRVDVYQGAVTGQRPPESQHVNGWITGYKKEGFARYKSHTQGEAAQAMPADKRGQLWKRPAILAIPIALVAVFMIPKIIADSTEDMAKASTTTTAPAKPAQAAPPTNHAPAPTTNAPSQQAQTQPSQQTQPSDTPQQSGRWVLLGVMTKANGEGIAMVQSSTGTRRIPASDCHETATDWRCTVDGELVAMWTGSGLLRLARSSTYMDASQ